MKPGISPELVKQQMRSVERRQGDQIKEEQSPVNINGIKKDFSGDADPVAVVAGCIP